MIQKIKSSLTKKQNEITKTYKSQISNCISMLPGDWNGPPDESFSFQLYRETQIIVQFVASLEYINRQSGQILKSVAINQNKITA